MKVFISHGHQDRDLASFLRHELAKDGFDAFQAEDEVLPGDNWALKAGQALEDSDAMVVLVSPDSVRSRRVRREIDFALGSSKYAGRVIPVVVEPTEDMPWFLRKLTPVKVGRNRAQLSKRIIDQLRLSGN